MAPATKMLTVSLKIIELGHQGIHRIMIKMPDGSRGQAKVWGRREMISELSF